jgi:hypothetical protein
MPAWRARRRKEGCVTGGPVWTESRICLHDGSRIEPVKQELARMLSSLPPPDQAGAAAWVLELHAFVAAWIAGEITVLPDGATLSERLAALARHLALRGYGPADLQVLKRMERENAVAAAALAGPEGLDTEEARAAAHDFLRFCTMCGFVSPALDPIRAFRDGWAVKTPVLSHGTPLSAVREEIRFAQPDTRTLLAQTVQWAKDKQLLAELDGTAVRIASTLERERGALSPAREALMRRELADVGRQKQAVLQKLEGYHDLDLYVQHVSRFSLYTRTRMDYERSVMKLTLEQAEAVEAVRPGHDFLIRGGAGTGKTIVLLHALQRIKRARESELALRPGSRLLFLTYTNTLVKFDRYIAEILREPGAESLIGTADSFFQARLTLLGRAQRVDYGIAARLALKLNTTGFFSAPELAVEIEDFLFGSLVSRREYIDEMIPRRGMRQPLTAPQRAAVWDIRDAMAGAMEHDGLLSKNYARLVLIRALEANPDDASLRDIDVALVDESQDLSAADLRALKLMTLRGLVMAGDTGQSIYGVSSPYRRAGLDVAGRTKILHTSFRSTLPIQEVADAYRRLSGLEDDEGAGANAFREGPVPELYTAGSRE